MHTTFLALVGLSFATYPGLFDMDDVIKPEAEQKVTEVLQSIRGPAVDVVTVEPAGDKGGPDDNTVVELRAKSWAATINRETGELYQYGIAAEPKEEVERSRLLALEDAITGPQAFEAFVGVARALLLPTDITAYSLTFVGLSPQRRELYRCRWIISRDFTYQGLICRDTGRDRGIVASLSAMSGSVRVLIHKPVVVPVDEEARVDEHEAERIAAEWLARCAYFSETNHRTARLVDPSRARTRLVVACPNSYPEGIKSIAEEYSETKSYYCWEVPFESKESGHWFTSVVWVRASTGEVIGGKDMIHGFTD
jgi:hypothetical protein